MRREARVDLAGFRDGRDSARNLLHYLALRQVDLRPIQRRLADLGLSSLGRAEGHTLYNLNAVLSHLKRSGARRPAPHRPVGALSPETGRRLLAGRARELFGAPPAGRSTRIMVTLPAEAATDYRLVQDLVAAGMDAARINCAHDDEAAWARMVDHVRRAGRALRRSCRVEMDLAGPKIRTGPLVPGPAVVKIRPHRDDLGRLLSPARVWLTPADHPIPPPNGYDAELRVDRTWLRKATVPSTVTLTDARGASRRMKLVRRRGESSEAEVRRTTYVTESTVLGARGRRGSRTLTRVASLAHREATIPLRTGDRLRVSAHPVLGGPLPHPGTGRSRLVGEIACTLPTALRAVRVGDPIFFDDGKIGGIVERTRPDGLVVRITHAAPDGSKLRADRGINLPNTPLPIPSLTDEDRQRLPFIAAHADLVGFSFVRSAGDVAQLRAELAAQGHPRIGIVLKIETRAAFDELPAILLEGLRDVPVGVMIARGDLAIEVGYERLAEVQEEILWLCEAAHLPTIWATEVLEGLAKSGAPTRAEVTDAAMGERAECVMLNKGPHIVEAVRALDNILRRMQAHQEKKSARLRHLSVAERFFHSKGPGEPSVGHPHDRPGGASDPPRPPT